MRYLFLIGLLLGSGLSIQAQPGPWGGSIRFRLFSPQGQLVQPGSHDYACFPTWEPVAYSDQAEFSRTISPGTDGYWHYQSLQTTGGARLPAGFAINIVHGRDTMRMERWGAEAQFDSIPFLPGRFTLAYSWLLGVKPGAGHIANVGWEFLRDSRYQPDRLTAERLELRPTEDGALPPVPPPSCSRLLIRYAASTQESAVYLATGGRPRLLLRRLPGRPVAACSGAALLLLLGGLVLKSDDDGTTWRLYEVQEGRPWQRGAESVAPRDFQLRKFWTKGNRVLAAGYRGLLYRDWQYQVPGIFELHFTSDTAAPTVQRSYARARADAAAAIARRTEQLTSQFYQSLREARRTPEHQAAQRQLSLRHCTLRQGADNPDWPVLTLQDGQFQYDGTHWTREPKMGHRVPRYRASGTYALTDSTLTFRPLPGSTSPPQAPDADFYPAGTYYYYYQYSLGQPVITLTKWQEELDRGSLISLDPQP